MCPTGWDETYTRWDVSGTRGCPRNGVDRDTGHGTCPLHPKEPGGEALEQQIKPKLGNSPSFGAQPEGNPLLPPCTGAGKLEGCCASAGIWLVIPPDQVQLNLGSISRGLRAAGNPAVLPEEMAIWDLVPLSQGGCGSPRTSHQVRPVLIDSSWPQIYWCQFLINPVPIQTGIWQVPCLREIPGEKGREPPETLGPSLSPRGLPKSHRPSPAPRTMLQSESTGLLHGLRQEELSAPPAWEHPATCSQLPPIPQGTRLPQKKSLLLPD